MSAPTVSSVQVVPGTAAGSFVVDPAVAELLPATDALWHEVYHVIAPISESASAQLWRAYRTDTAAEVILRVLLGVKGDARADAWSRLSLIEHPNLQKACEAHYVDKYRVEIYSAPVGVTLDGWRNERSKVEISVIETIVRNLSEALGILHANGLAHLGLQPNTVYIQDEKGLLNCTLSGLDTVVRFEGDKLIPARVNPLYAPPEAASLSLHEPGTTMCLWDWWTLGRTTQELILGHHVLDEFPNADPAQSEQDRWARAEALLFEQDLTGPRAGAVEVMTTDARLNVLLRGLLASSPEGRWGGEFVDRWLQQKLVKENYSDKRIETKFRWRGRLYTVPEAAKEMQSAELWEEAGQQVFKVGTPGMLAHFIKNMPEQHLVHKSLEDLIKFGSSDLLKSLPPAISRDIILLLALLQLAGERFLWRGRRINGEALSALLAEEPTSPERLAFVRALTDRSITAQVDRYDFEAGRSLAASGLLVADAEAMIRRFAWLQGKNEAESVSIFRLALEPESVLQAAHGRLKQAFAGASDPALDKIFKAEKPARSELIALAWVETKSAGRGFVTHQEMKSRRLAELEQRCQQMVGLIFWQKFARSLRAAPLIFGSRWLILAGGVTMMLFVAVLKPGPLGLILGLVPLGLLIALRLGCRLMQANSIKAWGGDQRPWGWDEHFARCRAEISQRIEQQALPATLKEALVMFDRLNRERVDLAKPDACPLIAQSPQKHGTGFAALASWVIMLVVVGGSIGLAVKTPPDINAHLKAWTALFASAPKEKVKPLEPPTTKISWPYKAPKETPFEITAMGVFNPSSEQSKLATERAQELLKGYKPETIDGLIAIYVPLEGANGGLLLYDGVKGAFMGRNGVLINFVPMPKMWMEIGDQRAIFIEK